VALEQTQEMVTAVDRLPPHNLEAEQSALGSMLLDRDAIIRVETILRPEDFYQPSHGVIYQAMRDLYNRREPTDILTLSDELSRRGQLDQVGGLAYLTGLIESVPTAVHVEYYSKIVERTATMRRLINAGANIVGIGYQEDLEVEDAIDLAERSVFDVSQRRLLREFIKIDQALEDFFDSLGLRREHRDALVGVPTGFVELDKLTGGLQKSDLIIVAARPAFGKSAFALGIAYTASVLYERTVGIFSLEMSAEQIVQRLVASETGVDSHRLRLGQIEDNEWERVTRAFGRLSNAPMYVDDSALLSIADVRTKARRLQAEHGLDLLIVDYLQLMQGRKAENRVQEIADISRGLKGLARELNIPVLALSQLSRAIESRHGHKPQLSDLRESGSIEQDADIVMFIHREDKYSEESSRKNVADIFVEKHRNGPTGKISLRFFEQSARFTDLQVYRDSNSP
jgi:replicative DNA helicase